MKKIIVFTSLLFLFNCSSQSQMPQYYNSNTGTGINTYPWGQAAGQRVQWLIRSGTLINPAPCPGGTITNLYFYMGNSGSATFTNMTIKMGNLAISTLPASYDTTGLTLVYQKATVQLSSSNNTWMVITLNTPFAYDTSKALVIDVRQCGYTGTGLYVRQGSGVPATRNFGTPMPCPVSYIGQDGQIINFGVDILPPPSVNRALMLPTPGVNTHYVMIPHQSGMIGFTNITIEGWMKISGFTTNSTLLNKGASSFDYQLGVTSGRTVAFRAQGTIVIATSIIMPVDTWTHLAVTYDGTTCKFYRNGVLAQTESAPGALGNSMNEMRIGRGSADPGSGLIDEVRLWNVVRTEAQISADMCNKWVPNNATGLKAKWHFDSTYTDSVSGWHGTPTTSSVGFDTVTWCPIVGIEQISTTVPKEFSLAQNYPNPFNPTTTITFSLPKEGYVEIKLFDVTGKEVATLVSDPYRAGTYSVEFDATKLASGVYFYKITTGDFTATKKMVLIK